MRHLTLAFCFDDGYALPAAVSFYSLLTHAKSPDTVYDLNVVSDRLGDSTRTLLSRIVSHFPQATLSFCKPPPLPHVLCEAVGKKSHYSPALFHKLSLPEMFPNETRLVSLDVDTLYVGDVARLWDIPVGDALLSAAPEPLYFGWRGEGPKAKKARKVRKYWRLYTEEERRRMTMNAGLIIFNLERIRECGAVKQWIRFAVENAYRLVLPEQDVFNLATEHPPATIDWDVVAYAPSADDLAVNNAVQVHYTSRVKPWSDPGCRLASLWYAVLEEAKLVEEWRKMFSVATYERMREAYARRLISCKIGRFSLSLLKLPKACKVDNDAIDILYLWCDLADSAFRAKREAVMKRIGLIVKEGDNGTCRYLSHDELRYSLRSVDKFLPWVRHVHLVVDDDIALPSWLDVSNPRLVIHRWGDIMPPEKLPCFNSTTFEFFLQDIPGLSNRFLYANDDMLVMRSLKPSFFFASDGWPIFRYTRSRLDMDAPEIEDGFLHRVRESFRFARKTFGVRGGYKRAFGHLSHHNIDAYVKSDLAAFKAAYPDVWDKQTSHPFRDRSQLQREVFAGFAFSLGHAHYRQISRPWWETIFGLPHRDSWHCIPVKDNLEKTFRRIKPKLMCMNDSPAVTPVGRSAADSFLRAHFPHPSSFEIRESGGRNLISHQIRHDLRS